MTRRFLHPISLSLFLVAGCATVGGSDDAGADLAAPDLARTNDAGPDLKPCVLGTADSCGTCGNRCPPGMDDEGTRRACTEPGSFGMCEIQCKGEWYDVDGTLANGCEALDEPVQDMPSVAAKLVNDPATGTNPLNIAGRLYGDKRVHVDAPAMRQFGRDDWYSITAVGAGTAGKGMTACLGITNFPTDNVFLVCISAIGQITFAPGSCKMIMGGAPSACVTPPGGTDAGGPYYVRIQKINGMTQTLNKYALYLEH